MKTERNILVAFILNLSFAVFELFGGVFTNSIAVISDSVHDIGDAAGICISYFFEKKSKRQPDEKYTYGYKRYSALGGLITTLILIAGSVLVVINAISRIKEPKEIDYDGVIIFAVIGVCINLVAAFFTRERDSVNQKAVNLHMLEDVLGWVVVLIGSVVMRFTDFALIDPIMSVGVSLFILVNAVGNLREIINLFLEKTPDSIGVAELKEHIIAVDGVIDVHHIHIRSLDGQNNCATMHIVTDSDSCEIKEKVRSRLHEIGIGHATLELESQGEHCNEEYCRVDFNESCEHHRHCGHHHH